MKHATAYQVLMLSAISLFFAAPALAFVMRTGGDITVPKGETINETLLAAGQTVTVDGDVKGDIICAAQTVTINGSVDGDVLCAGQNVTVTNSVAGSVRAMGQNVQISGAVTRNVTVAGQTVTTGAAIGGEMLFASQKAAVNGQISKSVGGAANSITIGGNIGGNAQFAAKNLTLQNGAVVGGSLAYTSPADAVIDQGSKIAGNVTHSVPPAAVNAPVVQNTPEQWAQKKLRGLIINLVVALLLAFFFKKSVQKITDSMLAKPGHAFGWGILFLILTPIVGIATALTIIGIPVAMILILLFIAALFLSRIFAAMAVGKKITQMYWKAKADSAVWQVVVGVFLMWILFAVPVVGWIISGVSVIWGLGGIYYLFRRRTI